MPTNEEKKEEPSHGKPENNPGDTGGFIATPNERDWGREHSPGLPASDGSEPFGRTSRAIAKSIDDIATGRSVGEHPAVDAIIGRDPARYATPGWADTVCGPDCPNRQRPEHRGHEGAVHAPGGRPVIADIRPTLKERMYSAERDILEMNRSCEDVKRVAHEAATKDDFHFIDKRVDNVHVRIDRDVLPVFKDISESIDKLETRRWIKDIIVVTTLVVSLVGNLLALYKLFIEH